MPKHSASVSISFDNSEEVENPVVHYFSNDNSRRESWRVEVYPESCDVRRSRNVSRAWTLDVSARPPHDMYGVEVSVVDDNTDRRIVKHLVKDVIKCADSFPDSGAEQAYSYQELGRLHWPTIFEFTFDENNLKELERSVYYVELELSVKYFELRDKPKALLEAMSSDLDRLLQSGTSSDVIFEVGGEEIPAHKLILSTRLAYFQSLFDAGMREATTNRVVIEDIDATSFKAVLKFLYCGRLPEDLQTSAKNYLPIAEKYDIRALKEACETALSADIDRHNVVDILIMANIFRCSDLKAKAMNLFMQIRKSLSEKKLEPLKAHPELMFECLKKG